MEGRFSRWETVASVSRGERHENRFLKMTWEREMLTLCFVRMSVHFVFTGSTKLVKPRP